MTKEKQIEFERNEISEIIAKNFKPYDEQYDPSDFEWSAHCVQMAGYRKQSEGKWEQQLRPYEDEIVCSVCGANFNVIDNCTEKFNHCPNCGARMSGGQNEQCQ